MKIILNNFKLQLGSVSKSVRNDQFIFVFLHPKIWKKHKNYSGFYDSFDRKFIVETSNMVS